MRSRPRRFLAQGWLQGKLGRNTVAAFDRQHQQSAEAIYELAVRLEGLPIKVCQFLGSRADVLPKPYVAVLSLLQDRVPARSMEDWISRSLM